MITCWPSVWAIMAQMSEGSDNHRPRFTLRTLFAAVTVIVSWGYCLAIVLDVLLPTGVRDANEDMIDSQLRTAAVEGLIGLAAIAFLLDRPSDRVP